MTDDTSAGEWWRGYGAFAVAAGELERLDALAEAESEAIWKLLGLDPGARILDAPCGFGRHATRLASWGAEVWGVDLDAELLDHARTRAAESGVELRLDVADLRTLPVSDGWAVAVVNLGSSLGLFDDPAGDAAFLAEARRVLADGGTLLLETTHRDAVIAETVTPRVWERRTDGTLVLQERRFDVVSGRLDTALTVVAPDGARTGRIERPRIYSLTELTALLHAAGFGDVAVYGGWAKEPPSSTARAVLVAR